MTDRKICMKRARDVKTTTGHRLMGLQCAKFDDTASIWLCMILLSLSQRGRWILELCNKTEMQCASDIRSSDQLSARSCDRGLFNTLNAFVFTISPLRIMGFHTSIFKLVVPLFTFSSIYSKTFFEFQNPNVWFYWLFENTPLHVGQGGTYLEGTPKISIRDLKTAAYVRVQTWW